MIPNRQSWLPVFPLSWAPLCCALLLCAAPACKPGSEAGAQEPLSQALRRRQTTRVRVEPLVVREMLRTLSTTTNVESEYEIQVFPRVSGVLQSLRVEEGDRVEAGAVLAVLDQRDAQALLLDARVGLQETKDEIPGLELAVEEALERVASARLAWEQGKHEVQRNEQAALLSEVEMGKLRLARDTAERDHAAARLGQKKAEQTRDAHATTIERAILVVERQELGLSYTEITAPFAGVIAARMVKQGDAVSTGAALFTLTDPDHLRAIVYRPQSELIFFQRARARVEGGGEEIAILVRPDALPGEEYLGRIRILSPTVDPESGSFRLTIDLEQPPLESAKPRLLPGMLVRLEIVSDRHLDAMVVPKRAVRREGDAHFVFVVRQGRAVRVAVQEGFSESEHVEILPVEADSLAAGDLVVVAGNRDLEDGTEVVPEQRALESGGQAEPGDLKVAGDSEQGSDAEEQAD
ncbi:MAG: efflux RND transporter periplasmic adaptor subunit [Planctomycetota bacterium]